MMTPTFAPELFARVFRNTRPILVALVIPPLIAGILSVVLKPVYQADARLTLKPGRNESANGNSGQSEQAASQPGALNGHELVQGVLAKVAIPAVPAKLSVQSTILFAEEKALMLLHERLDVRPMAPSNMLGVSAKSTDPAIAVKLLQTFLADLQAQHTAAPVTDSAAPIERQISEKQKQIRDLDTQRAALDESNGGEPNGEESNGAPSIADQRTRLTRQRTQLTAALQDAESKRDLLQGKIDDLEKRRANTPKSKTLAPEGDADADPAPITSDALARLMVLRRKELQLLQKHPATDPAVQQVHAQISVAEKVVQLEQAQAPEQNDTPRTVPNPQIAVIDRQLQATSSDLAPVVSGIEDDRSEIAAIDVQLGKLAGGEASLNDLRRRMNGLTADLQTLQANLNQARAADEAKRTEAPGISVVDAPRLQPQPVFPKQTLFVWVGLAVGGVLALWVVLTSLASRRTILTAEGAECILDKPVVAELPKFKRPGAS
jgi:uncharacterized protein involved in exopolysaccharide biosynthesis